MKKIYLILSIFCLSLCVKAQEPTKFKIALKNGDVTTYNISDIDYMSVEADQTQGGDKPDVLAGKTYTISLPAIGTSDDCKVYTVMSGSSQVAEVCYEYIKCASADERMVVVYPIGSNGKADLTKGYVPANGGSLVWDLANNSCTYTPGNGTAVSMLYLEDGQFVTSTSASAQATTVSQYMLTDVRGLEENTYSIVKVGTQYWMGENLRTFTLTDETPITLYTTTQGTQWNNTTAPAYHIWSDDMEYTWPTWGCMYNGYAVMSDKLAPEGWIVTSMDDWRKLKTYLAKSQSLKVKSTTEWNNTPGVGNNLSGLNIAPGGYFLNAQDGDNEAFSRVIYWTTDKLKDSLFKTDGLGSVTIYNSIYIDDSDGNPSCHGYQYGQYVRCIRK